MKYGKSFAILLLTFGFLFSCKDNRLLVDISTIQVEIDFVNVDQAFLNAQPKDYEMLHLEFVRQLGDIYWFELAMNLQTRDSLQMVESLLEFYSNDYILKLESEKSKILSSIADQERLMVEGFRYLRYHFPNIATPKTIFYINKLFSGIKANESFLSVALENYIDPKSSVVEQIPTDNLYQWQKDRMDISFLARDVLQFWIQNELFQEKDDHLAYHIIQAGKVNYLLYAAMPKSSAAQVLRYSDDQFKWAEENEFAFWEYLVRENLLFKNNLRDKTNFLNEGPYTVGLPEKGPDRLGQFLGFKMVQNYMNKNKDLSLQQLLETDFNTILQSYDI